MSKKKSAVPYYSLFLAVGIFIGVIVSKFVLEAPPSKPDRELEYQFCFPPQQKCLPLLLSKLLRAKTSVKIQGYVFTSRALANALISLHHKGVQVTLILDKSQVKDKRSQIKRLSQAGIPIFIDYKPAIAHNKIVILDNSALFTGSYNFSEAAEKRNAENLLFLKEKNIVQAYLQNFHKRLEQAQLFYDP